MLPASTKCPFQPLLGMWIIVKLLKNQFKLSELYKLKIWIQRERGGNAFCPQSSPPFSRVGVTVG